MYPSQARRIAAPHAIQLSHTGIIRVGQGDGPAEHGARQLQDGDRSKDDRHAQGVTLRVHDRLPPRWPLHLADGTEQMRLR